VTLLSNQPSPDRRKGRLLCGAKTRAGGYCQVRVEPGKARCRFHGGKSTGPRRRWVEHVSPRPSDSGGSPIERGLGRSEAKTKPDLEFKFLMVRTRLVTS
jgi:hypothetical protein